MSNVSGDQNGINVLSKIAKSETPAVQRYYAKLISSTSLVKVGTKIYFSDIEEQLKTTVLNSETIYSMYFDAAKDTWNVAWFVTPRK